MTIKISELDNIEDDNISNQILLILKSNPEIAYSYKELNDKIQTTIQTLRVTLGQIMIKGKYDIRKIKKGTTVYFYYVQDKKKEDQNVNDKIQS